MTCLTRQQVIDIILSNAKKGPMSADELYDQTVKDIAGRYFFSEDYTLDDMIYSQIADNKLSFNKNTRTISYTHT